VRTSLDCVPCFVRQGLEASRFVTEDQDTQAEILREVLRLVADLDLTRQPVTFGQAIHRRVRELTAAADPYRSVKSEYNRLVGGVLPELARLVRASADPLVTAARLAIAGNVIDFAVPGALQPDQVLTALRGALDEPFHGDTEAFSAALTTARNVLYLLDNAGEIATDRLLVEEIGADRVTAVVRGGPIINDAVRADAVEVGLAELVEVIDNGSDAPGTVLTDCSESFLARLRAADLVVAKGQGNFETLSSVAVPVFFLFKIKCPVVAGHTGLDLGTHALLRGSGTDPVPAA